MRVLPHVRTTTTTTTTKVQTHSFSWCEVGCLLCSHQLCTFMWSQVNGEHAGAARRRRERRLRQFLRHKRLSVAMALAESLHHAAPRGQKMARAGGVEREENFEPWLLDPPLRQVQSRLVTWLPRASPLHTPLLADTVANTVDARTVKFLLQMSLSEKKNREEEERKGEEERHERRMLELNHRVGEGLSLTDAEWSAWCKWATSSSSSAGKRRKRKKRRKKKTPQTSSSGVRIRRCGHGRALVLRGFLMCSLPYCSSGRAGRRRCQWYVHGWFFWLCYLPCGALPGQVVLARRCVQRQVPVLVWTVLSDARGDSTGAVLGRGANRLEVPQLQLILKDVDISACGAEADPRGLGEIPRLPYSWWSMSLLCSSTSLSRWRGFFS